MIFIVIILFFLRVLALGTDDCFNRTITVRLNISAREIQPSNKGFHEWRSASSALLHPHAIARTFNSRPCIPARVLVRISESTGPSFLQVVLSTLRSRSYYRYAHQTSRIRSTTELDKNCLEPADVHFMRRCVYLCRSSQHIRIHRILIEVHARKRDVWVTGINFFCNK